jgi:hypothetical protein
MSAKGKGLLLAIGMGKKPQDGEEEEAPESEDSEDGSPGEEDAMKDFCDAYEAKDYAAMADALKTFLDIANGG